MKPQDILSSFYRLPKTSIWDDSPNYWVRLLSPQEFGSMCEDIAVICLGGGQKTKNNSVGYDIDLGAMKVEVKAATVSISSGYPVLSWKAIRPTDPYTHLFFLAIYPGNMRVFLVPRNSVPSYTLSPMTVNRSVDAGRSAVTNFQIHVRKVFNLPDWLVQHELVELEFNGPTRVR